VNGTAKWKPSCQNSATLPRRAFGITDSDNGRVIAESGAIIDYILRRHGNGRLQPDPASAAYDDYVHWLQR
jgi:hypothetical protein